jgi:hypothetical protein
LFVPALTAERWAVAFRAPWESIAVGVGSSRPMLVSDGRTAAPGLGDWLFPYGVAVGVGRSW